MNHRALALTLALLAASQPVGLLAQGLRASPQLGASRPALPSAPSGPRQADYIVAIVNSEPITNNEVRFRLVRAEQQLVQQGGVLPPRDQMARQVLERMISEKAQLQLAREGGMKVEDTAVDQAEANVARQNQIDVVELRKRLVADGLSVAGFRDELRSQILLARVREREVEPKVRVSDLEIDQFIQEQQGSNDISTMELNLAQILIATPEGATAAQKTALQARAQRALDRARAGEDFGKLVREFSDAPGAATAGGQMGMRPADRYPPLFVNAVQTVPEGGLSPVIQSEAGFHVLKVVEKRQAGMPGINVIQSRVRHILLRPGPQLGETAALERLADFRKRVVAGTADFAQLARENSQDGSARNGGDLGWTNPGIFVPEFEDAVSELQPGQISEPVVSRFSVHLIQLMERRQATLSQREQRDIARNLVREKKLEEAYAEWLREVRGRAFVEMREPPQ